METELKHYEIAYLLHPSIDEEEVLSHAGKITALVEETKGMINHAEAPKKRKLMYLINREQNAYFGWTQFLLLPELVAELDKKLKLSDRGSLMRYLIVEQERTAAPALRTLRKASEAREQQGDGASGTSVPQEEKLDLEALDKKLEEILGK